MVAEAVIDLPDRTQRRRPIEPGTQMWEEMGLVTFFLTAGSAFVLQAMHHSVSTVVSAETVARTDLFGRGQRSIASVMTWVYGGEEALVEADRLRAMHATLKAADEHGGHPSRVGIQCVGVDHPDRAERVRDRQGVLLPQAAD